ncbi:YbbR-like protein [Psychroflexus salarius]|uniref:YbbR-like protein n=1 Tax=Psychroflexus salarius TaxID=1155689 RepID=A0A1M4W608_9FLAO|nr:YbbR-like domain-containing protein [Psychroflexus salarius]SHE76656.1 YbbR-like protein [Psychroflexus salarius]
MKPPILKRLTPKLDHNKAFVFILISTAAIWFVLQLSKTYTTQLQLNYSIINLPKEYKIEKEQKLSIYITSNGLNLLYLNLFNPEINIDYSEFTKSYDFISIDESGLNNLISTQLELDKNQIEAHNLLKLDYYKLFSKQIEVFPNLDLTFQPGFDTIQDIQYSPSQITIYGREDALSSIDSVFTNPITHRNIKDSISSQIDLNLVELDYDEVNTNVINYTILVDRFTEKTITLPVEVINLPSDTNISIYPKQLEVSFELPLSKYNQVSAKNFKLICDYSRAKISDNYLIPKLVKSPKFIKYERLRTKQISYLIKE